MIVETGKSFRAMNTDVECVVCGPEECREEAERAVDRVVDLFKRAEKTLSRFDAGSELSKLNAHAGHLFKTSRFLFEVVEHFATGWPFYRPWGEELILTAEKNESIGTP